MVLRSNFLSRNNVEIPILLKIGLCVSVFWFFPPLNALEIHHRNEEVKVLNWFVLFYLRRMFLFVRVSEREIEFLPLKRFSFT